EFDLPYGLSINYEPSFWKMIFASRLEYVYLAGGFLLLVLAVAFLMDRSYIGYYLRAIRDNDEAAEAAGISVRRYKLLALLVSTFLTSLGGTILAQYTLYIEPETVFNISISINLALMSILGGLGTLLGPVVGAIIALPLQEFLRDWFGAAAAGAHLAVYGVLLIVMVVAMPQGIVGALAQVISRRRARSLSQPTAPEASS
ncbi:MAG: branched-chain amino acid ABC transporter permease, partial [Alphaproteobacteria bacterium]|nr:branched-chain amino acid ABC transporter permease [Alphaproteobacteria bacterium]MDX5369822.1 branched-chain amino acid ABC transporter permease [Alphaproteobacteria bacterium]